MVISLYNRINGRKQLMDLPEQRILGSLILLAGISFLAVGLYTDQLTTVTEILGEILKTAIAG
jgi:hypothetical protein